MMETNNNILATLNQNISPLNNKLIRVKKRLDLTKDNIINVFDAYSFIMSHKSTLRKLLSKNDDAIFDVLFSIREPCVKFKILAEQYKIDRDEFLIKFFQQNPILLNQQHENMRKMKELLGSSKSEEEANKIKLLLDTFQIQLDSIETDFLEFNNFYQSGTVEKLIDECETTIQSIFEKAKPH
ncbi:MAG: hypothetical protein WAW86_10625 [Gammaproteobacteria bacterium]